MSLSRINFLLSRVGLHVVLIQVIFIFVSYVNFCRIQKGVILNKLLQMSTNAANMHAQMSDYCKLFCRHYMIILAVRVQRFLSTQFIDVTVEAIRYSANNSLISRRDK